MSVNGGPDIVSDGLVLYLNAIDSNSYVPGASNWVDLVSRKVLCPMINSPTFDPTFGGSIVYNGTNTYTSFYAPNLGTTTTVEMWARIGSGYSNKMFFGWFQYDVWCGNGNLGYNTAQGDIYGITSAAVSSLGLVNSWKHYIFEMRSDVSYTNNKIYVNGVSQSLSQVLSNENVSNRDFNNGYGRISNWSFDLLYLMPMNCSVFKVYNRSLSQSEIDENFNYFRKRYGI
jgi:hypothetical protein